MISPRTFLDAVSGYVSQDKGIQNGRAQSSQRPHKIGVILAASDNNGLPRVLFDGESTPSERGYTFASSYSPVAGDRVVLAPVGTTYMIVAAIATSPTDTGWVNLILPTGIVANSGRTPQIRRVGNMFSCRGGVSKSDGSAFANSNVTIATLPPGFSGTYPANQYYPVFNGFTGNSGTVTLPTNRTLIQYQPGTTGTTYAYLDSVHWLSAT